MDMTISATGRPYGIFVVLIKCANYNRFNYNEFIGVSTTVDSNSFQLIYSPATSSDNYNIFGSNIYTDGSYGIYLAGDQQPDKIRGTEIYNSDFNNQRKGAIYL